MSATTEKLDSVPLPDADERFALPSAPGPHPLTRRKVWLPILILLVVLNIPFLHLALRGAARTSTTVPFSDNFERAELGEHYFATGGHWRIINGELFSPGVKNNPLWLQAKLPRDVVVEFDARGEDTAGDIKAEIFGNGRDHSSGYVLVFGGWNNTISTLARLNEHGDDRKENRTKRVEKGKTYHFKIVRDGTKLTWFIDGEQFLEYDDPNPLTGSSHDRFGFGTWASDVYFDNLTIQPLR